MCRLRELNPRLSVRFRGGKNVPTFAPGSYKESVKRPQFFPQQPGALIRNEPQTGRGSAFRLHILYPGHSYSLETPYSCFCCLVRAGDASRRVVFGRDFRRDRGSNPPTTLPRRVPLPTELAGHRHVQPRPPLFREDIIVDPCRFEFSPHFLRYSKIVQPLNAHFTAFSCDNTD